MTDRRPALTARRFPTPEQAALAYAENARVRRPPSASAAAARLRESGVLVEDAGSWRLTRMPPRRGNLSLGA